MKGQQHTQHGRPLAALQVLSQSGTLPLGSFCLWLILVGLAVEAQKGMLGQDNAGRAVHRAVIH